MPRIVKGAMVTKRGQAGSRWPIVKLHGGWKAAGAVGVGVERRDVGVWITRSGFGWPVVDSISIVDEALDRSLTCPALGRRDSGRRELLCACHHLGKVGGTVYIIEDNARQGQDERGRPGQQQGG